MPATAPSRITLACLRRLHPLRALSSARLRELSRHCRSERLAQGDDPLSGSAAGGQSVYLLGGEVKLGFADGSSSVLVGGSDAARWPFRGGHSGLRQAKAITALELLRLDDDTLDIMMTWDQVSAASAAIAPQAEAPDWQATCGAFRLHNLTAGALSRLPAANIGELFARLERLCVEPGTVVVRQGDPGDYYYLVESGLCRVSRRVGGVDMPLAELKAGDAFGEEALVADEPRNASVSMPRGGVLLRLGKADFIALLREPLLKRVDWREAECRVRAGARWLDVRYAAEYRLAHLPGAVNVPLGEIRNAIGLLEREREYIVYCQSGRRSSAAAFLLAQHGYRVCCLERGLAGSVAPGGGFF